MVKKTTLVILAAGLGSRYNGMKQTDSFGPSGESILDYTVYDAINVGFKKVVFVIRASMKDTFIPLIKNKLGNQIEYAFVFQELDALPDGCEPSSIREKPWGTAHAIWCTRHEVNDTFAIVNADDFYGRDALAEMIVLLKKLDPNRQTGCLIGFKLENTLSEFGSVSRGICALKDGYLKSITEQTAISKKDEDIIYEENGAKISISGNTTVSMNLMGFTSSTFNLIESEFKTFYTINSENPKAEFYAPTVLQKLIDNGENIPVNITNSTWFGVTYPDDKTIVQQQIASLVESGMYPHSLFSND